jgi:hypothetical protein
LLTRAEDAYVSAIALLSQNNDPNSLQRAGLETERDRILTSVTMLTAETQVGEVLDKMYKELLK